MRLALEGHTNTEIASELGLTMKTISRHTQRALAALGCPGNMRLGMYRMYELGYATPPGADTIGITLIALRTQLREALKLIGG